MLKIINNLNDLDIRQLMAVYEETNRLNGAREYKNLPENLQILYAEQDFYAYLDLFFASKGSIYAVWAPEGAYKAALRVERYRDGSIITGLETAPVDRRKGYAMKLLQALIHYLKMSGHRVVYSHIEKSNEASLCLHQKIGFQKISDTATYIDGTIHKESATYCLTL